MFGAEQGVGFGVVDDFHGDRIELQRAVDQAGDVAQQGVRSQIVSVLALNHLAAGT